MIIANPRMISVGTPQSPNAAGADKQTADTQQPGCPLHQGATVPGPGLGH
ncbi:MAG: hypothetical protein R3F53_15570 [Gammaproteobacteria bacterium]